MSGEVEVAGPHAPGPFPSPFHESGQGDDQNSFLPAQSDAGVAPTGVEKTEASNGATGAQNDGNGGGEGAAGLDPLDAAVAPPGSSGGGEPLIEAPSEMREDPPGNAASVASGPGPGEQQPSTMIPIGAMGPPGAPGMLVPRPPMHQGMPAPMQILGPGRGAMRPPGPVSLPGGVRPVLVKGASAGRGLGPGPRGPGPPLVRGGPPPGGGVPGVGRGMPAGAAGRGEAPQGMRPQAPGGGRGQPGAPAAGRGAPPGSKAPAPLAQGVPMGTQGQFIQPPHGYMQPYPHVYHYPGPVMHPSHFQGGPPSSHMLPPPPIQLSPGGKHVGSQPSPGGPQKGASKQGAAGDKAGAGVRGGGALQAVAIAPAPAPPQVVRPAPPPRYTNQGKKPLGRPPKQGGAAQARLAPKGAQRLVQSGGGVGKQVAVTGQAKGGAPPPAAGKPGASALGAPPGGRAPSPSNSGGKGGPARKISCEDIQLVQNLIERCLQLYMNQREVIQTLSFQAKIEPGFTSLVWQKLEEQNPAFFAGYYVRLKVKEQITLFNHLLDQHVHLMHKLRNYAPHTHKQPHPLPPPPHLHPMGPPPPYGVPMPRPPAPGMPLHPGMPGLHPPGMLNGGAHMAMGPPPGPPGPFAPHPGGPPGSMALGSPLQSSGSPLPPGLGPGSSPGGIPPSSSDATPAFEPFAAINMGGPPDMPMEASFMSPEAHPPVHHEEPHSAEGGALTPGDTGIGMKPSESLGALGHLPRNFSLSDLTGAAELGGNNLSANDGQLGLLGSLSGSPLVFSPDSAEAFLRSPDRNLDADFAGDDPLLEDGTPTDDPLDFDKLR